MHLEPEKLKAGSAIQAAINHGIDWSLIEINLQKTPYERLTAAEESINSISLLREAMNRQHDSAH